MPATTVWTTVPDKASWGPGPWVDEPDKAQWIDEATGLPCLAVRSRGSTGVWCGYVGVHADHPLYGANFEDHRLADVYIDVPLDYAAACQGEDCGPMDTRVCHIPQPGEPDDVWWFGFACCHVFDYAPKMGRLMARLGPDDPLCEVLPSEVYRTLGYVQEQCAELARQLAALT